ncbi:MAG: hypothetical protein MJE77_00110 [Proteobacteria bacterium]|nr:hypothetical protein [Pseudomonadota bacterium]
MSDRLVDSRTLIARSASTRVELGRDGVLHVRAGPVTLHLARPVCEELTTTLARAMVILAEADRKTARPELKLIRGGSGQPLPVREQPSAPPATGEAR